MKIGDEVIILEDRIVGGMTLFKAGEVTIIEGFSKTFKNVVHVKYSQFGSMTVFRDKIIKLNKKNACQLILQKMLAA